MTTSDLFAKKRNFKRCSRLKQEIQVNPKKPTAIKLRKSYAIDQCALYKIGSKKRLARVLKSDVSELLRLSDDDGNFKIFELEAQVCEFTGVGRNARWVQSPVHDLKVIQSRIAKLISRIRLPEYCHGATPGRSYRSNAHAHVGARAVAVFDFEKFFPSTTEKQVFQFFYRDLHCAPDVAGLLTDLCTYKRALPTGAPSSPILAYWANQRLFETLYGRGKDLGLKLSVYVDDITLSGDAIPRSLVDQVEGIVESYGHKLSGKKTKIFGPGIPKHVTGVVIADGKLRVPHARFRKARAIRAAYESAMSDQRRELLAAKLCGLLGEAAFLDDRYRRMARDSVKLLAAAKAKLPRRPQPKSGQAKRPDVAFKRCTSTDPVPF